MKKQTLHDLGLFALRVAVGVVFIRHGWQKLNGIEGVTGMLTNLGFFMPIFWAWVLALVEFVGGIAILTGVYARFFAKLIIIDMVVALLTAHLKGPFAQAELAIAMLGACLAILGAGCGAWCAMQKDYVWKGLQK